MTTVRERRIAEAAAKLDVISPPPSEYDRIVAENPELEWLTCDELLELEQFYRDCDDDPESASESAQAKALSIWLGARAKMLAGEPKDSDLPRETYEQIIQASYEKSQRELREKRAREARDDG